MFYVKVEMLKCCVSELLFISGKSEWRTFLIAMKGCCLFLPCFCHLPFPVL